MGKPSKGGNMTVPEETCKHTAQHQNQIRETRLERIASFIQGRYHHLCQMLNCIGDWQLELKKQIPPVMGWVSLVIVTAAARQSLPAKGG